MKLSIGLATRGRPDLLKHTLATTVAHISRPDTKLVVLVDDDDQPTLAAMGYYDHLPTNYLLDFPQVVYSVRPRPLGLGAKYNRLVIEYPADVYLVMVDYAPHITMGFDQRILEAASLYPDGIAVIYNNLVENLPAINAVTHKFTELNDRMIYAPWFPYGFVDIWLDDIAKAIGRIAYCNINIDRSLRPGTQGKRDERFWRTFYNLTCPLRIDTCKRIIDTMWSGEQYKIALRNNIPMWMQRALIHHMTGNLSDMSRTNWPEQFGGAAPDNAYSKACREQAVIVLDNMVANGQLTKEISNG